MKWAGLNLKLSTLYNLPSPLALLVPVCSSLSSESKELDGLWRLNSLQLMPLQDEAGIRIWPFDWLLYHHCSYSAEN